MPNKALQSTHGQKVIRHQRTSSREVYATLRGEHER